MRPISILATSTVIVMVAAGVLAGLAAYFHWGMPAIGALVGTTGLAALVALVTVCGRKKSRDVTLSQADDVNKKDTLVFGWGCSGGRLESTCQEAIQKIRGPMKIQKICIVENKGQYADTLFQYGDGYLQDFNFESFPNGSVLIIHLPGDQQKADTITCPDRFKRLVAAQEGRLRDFADRGHHYVALTWKEREVFYSNKQFPKHIRQIIKGK